MTVILSFFDVDGFSDWEIEVFWVLYEVFKIYNFSVHF